MNYTEKRNMMLEVADKKTAKIDKLHDELKYARKIYNALVADIRKAKKDGQPTDDILAAKERAHNAMVRAKIKYTDALDVAEWATAERLAETIPYLDTATVAAFIACKTLYKYSGEYKYLLDAYDVLRASKAMIHGDTTENISIGGDALQGAYIAIWDAVINWATTTNDDGETLYYKGDGEPKSLYQIGAQSAQQTVRNIFEKRVTEVIGDDGKLHQICAYAIEYESSRDIENALWSVRRQATTDTTTANDIIKKYNITGVIYRTIVKAIVDDGEITVKQISARLNIATPKTCKYLRDIANMIDKARK